MKLPLASTDFGTRYSRDAAVSHCCFSLFLWSKSDVLHHDT